MPVTVPTPVTRYFQPGLTKVYVVPVIAAFTTTGATMAELGAATDVTYDIAEVSGFSVSTADIAVPDWGTRFVGSIPGRITADSASITFYASATGADVRSILTQDLNTYIAFFGNGAVTGSEADYYKVTVSSVSHVRATEDAPKLMVGFTVRAVKENLLYPTS